MLDLEKAFDSLKWNYMFTTLERYKLGTAFLKLTRLLYTNPVVRVKMGPYISDMVPVRRGKRQACPLPPLLFVPAMEPLAESIRTQMQEGILIGDDTQKVSLYADDLLIYLQDINNVPECLAQILREFAAISGLKVNVGKSKLYAFGAGVPDPDLVLNGERVQWSVDTFRYLGIRIYRQPPDLFDGNLGKTLTAIKSQMQFWSTLPLAVTGRVALVKMVALPRFLYYFTNLPIYIPASFFVTLEKLVRDFIWGPSRQSGDKETIFTH